jgi:AcrR family transcriptional regulator
MRTPSAARARVLAAAERLFHERGYTGVTMQQLASELGMQTASLYYHAPGGKQELFTEVMEQSLERHREGLTRALTEAPPELRARLEAAMRWFLSQPTMNLERMVTSDFPALPRRTATRLQRRVYECLHGPLRDAMVEAERSGEIREVHADLIAGAILSWANAVGFSTAVRGKGAPPAEALAKTLVDVLLLGLVPR